LIKVKLSAIFCMVCFFCEFSFAGNGGQHFIVQFSPYLILTTPADLNWTMTVGEANYSTNQAVIVDSNESYGIKINCDTVAAGRMQEFDGTGYVTANPKKLYYNLQFKEKDNTLYTNISTMEQVVVSNIPSPGETTYVKYKQAVRYSDPVLPQGRVYRINIVYTVVQGW